VGTSRERARLVVQTVEVPDPGELLDWLPSLGGLAWVRRGDGLVASGEAARFEITGKKHCAEAANCWHDFTERLVVDDAIGQPGSGPVAFGSFAFDEETGGSVLVVPEQVIGRRDGLAWITTIGHEHSSGRQSAGQAGLAHPQSAEIGQLPPRPITVSARRPGPIRWAEGSVPVTAWRAAVAEAVRQINARRLDKVVLARDLLAYADEAVDTGHLLRSLASRFPDCWTFAVDGLVGATPELLIRRTGLDILSLVLAGTAWRHPGAEDEDQLAAELIASAKNQEEHVYAARSAAESLAPYCAELSAPIEPTILRLSNVLHLATEVTGQLAGDTDALTLAGALHPTAAVAGTPTDVSLDVIRELEGMNRGRYAGPVGWLDANGDGEWCIALRCAEVDGNRVRLFSGCGIVAGSDPDSEVDEAQAKFLAIRDALEARGAPHANGVSGGHR
jgi:menaquinone-specific isochorismate synthase